MFLLRLGFERYFSHCPEKDLLIVALMNVFVHDVINFLIEEVSFKTCPH